jgi:hypothetical protein
MTPSLDGHFDFGAVFAIFLDEQTPGTGIV